MQPVNDRQEELEARQGRRNFILGVLNGMLFRGSAAFLNINTLIPVFIHKLTSSAFYVGLAGGLANSGWFLPQFFVANMVAAKEYKKPTYIVAGVIRILSLAAIVLSIHILGGSRPELLLLLFFLFGAVHWFGAGIAGVSFVDIIARTIPARRLGAFWGWRIFLGGLLAAAAGWFFIPYIQERYSFPDDFFIFFLTALVLVVLATLSFSFAYERRDSYIRARKPLRAHIAEGLRIFRRDGQFRALFFYCCSLDIWMAGVPFYIVFATHKHHIAIPDTYLGYFVAAQTLGLVISNLYWAHAANSPRLGKNRGVLRLTSILAAVIPISVIACQLIPSPSAKLLVISVLFFLTGAVWTGWFIGYMNILIAICPQDNRPLYVGLMNTMSGPLLLVLGIMSGVAVSQVSFHFLFIVTAAAAVASFYSAGRLRMK